MVFKAFLLLFFVNFSRAFEDYESRGSRFPHIKSDSSPATQEQAVRDLVARILPAFKDNFFFKVDPNLNGESDFDKFEYTSVDSKLSVRCTSGVACGMAVNHFLKYFCNAHLSWSGDQLNIPNPFPVSMKVVSVTSTSRFRYYQNVCTSSYSFVWWDWTRWQREVDWMALNGINLPLAFTGQETIWQKVYLKMGLKQEELDSHFGGPAFLAWSRMGNMHGWGGPLPPSWYKTQLALQHKILSAMRNLGMTPVLPGFAGHVPKALTRIYPKANVSKLGQWGHFNATYCCTYLLDSSDPLFKQIGGAFVKAQIAEFGTNHIYNADTFNEMVPKSSDPGYLSAASKGVYEGMLAGDASAIWLMQGWLFLEKGFWKPPQVKALLQGVPQGKMIVLDLMAEVTPIWKETESFYGQPFIWCMLHNFGGNLGMYGAIHSITTNPILALHTKGSTMVGTGLTPEGINQNYIMYDMMNEMGTYIHTILTPSQALSWVESYCARRYGAHNAIVTKACRLLGDSVYNCTGTSDLKVTIVTNLPSLHISPHVWFKPEDLYQAWDLMVSVADNFTKMETFRHDLVDITREALHQLSITIYNNIVTAYNQKDAKSLSTNGAKLINLLTDLDSILITNEHFLLGKWLKAAKLKALGTTPNEVKLYEYNARNQITLWGPDGGINDYAGKMWSGLVNAYYKPRWQLFVKELETAVSQGKEIDYNAFKAKVFVQESAWNHGSEVYTPEPKGDSVEVAKALHKKYRV